MRNIGFLFLMVVGTLLVSSADEGSKTDEDGIKSLVTGAKEVEKTGRKISDSARKKIEEATGLTLAEADLTAPIFKVKAPLDQPPFSKDAEVLAVVATVAGPKGDIKLGVGMNIYKKGKNAYRIITHIKILDHKEDKEIEKPEFLQQFMGFSYGSGIEHPISELKQAIEKARNPGADALKGALGFNWAMHQVEGLWDSILYKASARDKAAGSDAEQLIKVLEQAEKSVGRMSYLAEGDKQSLRGQLSKFKGELKSAASNFKGGQFDRSRSFLNTAGGSYCGACHGPMERRLEDHRKKFGVADEYFMADYDTFVPSQTHLEGYQAVATGIKKAALMILLSE